MPRRSYRTQLVSQEAAEWYIRCTDDWPMVLADRKRMLAWLKRSPENISEILRISEMDGKFAKKKLLANIAALTHSNVIPLDPQQRHLQPPDDLEEEPTVRAHSWFSWKIAAVAATVILSFALWMTGVLPWSDRTIHTGPGQWQQLALEDGSIIHLDARTKVKVDFSGDRRTVRLLSGQAAFEVAKDKSRPFTVATDVVDVTAVGTQFAVSINPGVTTTVTEGVVKVTPHNLLSHDSAVLVHAGEELLVLDGGLTRQSAADVKRVDAERRLEWVDGWVQVDNESVGYIAEQFNRRSTMQIVIEDPTIAERRLRYYRVRVDSPESFARFVATEGVVADIDRAKSLIRLRRE